MYNARRCYADAKGCPYPYIQGEGVGIKMDGKGTIHCINILFKRTRSFRRRRYVVCWYLTAATCSGGGGGGEGGGAKI